MKVASTKIDKWHAREAFCHYKRLVADRDTEVDRLIMETYKQLAMGRQVITASQAIAAGGVDAAGLPRLAICRADARWVWFCPRHHWRSSTAGWSHSFISDIRPERHNWFDASVSKTINARHIAVRDDVLVTLRTERASAQVPVIPPAIRPRAKLSRYHILFEADWQAPPRDPLLLRRLASDLYVVLAQWDLTEVERLVLAAARNL